MPGMVLPILWLANRKIPMNTCAKGYLGQVYLSQGLLYKGSKRTNLARQCILDAIDIFQECEAGGWLKQANRDCILAMRNPHFGRIVDVGYAYTI